MTTEADDIWGAYSQRYADMATSIEQSTGSAVKVWCFVTGARRNRVFFTYEFPELQELEAAGTVQVFFAKSIDSDWAVPTDWDEGTENAPTPVDANITAYSFAQVPVLSAKIEEDIVFDVADAYLDGAFGSGSEVRKNALNELIRRNPGFSQLEYVNAFNRGLVKASH